MLSVFDMFKVGLGPSSSHTVGPMVAARRFVDDLDAQGRLAEVTHVQVRLYGSLGATGRGHGSDRAVLAGLAGHDPATVDPDVVGTIWADTGSAGRLSLLGRHPIAFHPERDVRLYLSRSLPAHPNGLVFEATVAGATVAATYYSVGGGFVQRSDELGILADPLPDAPHPFVTAADLLALCHAEGKSIARLVLDNEASVDGEEPVRGRLRETSGRSWRPASSAG